MLTYKLKERHGQRRIIEAVEINPEVWVGYSIDMVKARILDRLADRWGLELTESQGRNRKKRGIGR